MVFKLSPSSLNLMKDCQRCFWLAKHKVWKRPSGAFPTLPSGMDRILKAHFDRFMQKKQLPLEIKDEDHCQHMQLFDDLELLTVWRNNLKGIRWEDPDGNVFYGAVDNILVHKGKLVVLDYKTRGYAPKEDTADSYQNQLDSYNFLLRKNGYETEEYGFLLFYVPKHVQETGEVIFTTELVKRKIDVSNAEHLFQKALILLKAECPQKTCVWCEKV